MNSPEDRSVIARLSEFYHGDDDDHMWLVGRDEGYHWAEDEASAIELRRLAYDCSLWLDWYYQSHYSRYSYAERFFFIIRPDSDGDRMAAFEFWENEILAPRARSTTAWLKGFYEGAMEVWKHVKDRV